MNKPPPSKLRDIAVVTIANSPTTLTIPDAAGRPIGAPILDLRGRPLRDLRISVTDRCNFRCSYCMPKSVFDAHYKFLPQDQLLRFEELVRIAQAAHKIGLEKIRLTGGEPLLRRGIERLIGMLKAALPDVELTLTTNGSALSTKALALKAAGLDRLTISLDSLNDATFRAMNDVDFPVANVLRGIDAAAAAGFVGTKINMVVKRGVNDGDVLPMARHFKNTDNTVRFIEFMDVGNTNGWNMKYVVPSAEIIAAIHAEMPVISMQPNYSGEVAQRWQYVNTTSEVGVISSVTQAFCASCTRARLSTDGKLYTCLFANSGYDLMPLIRANESDNMPEDALFSALSSIWQQRNDNYSETRHLNTATKLPRVEMSFIGG
jgi:GTP 3',8-cyclase